MHIKFTKVGKSAKGLADYITADHDHQGVVRDEVQVLRGDPQLVAKVADSLTFKQRHSHAIIAWAREDAPTAAQIAETIENFEKMAFAGLEKDRQCWSAVLHKEGDGSVHLHLIAARVDLATGKAFNPAPPGWQSSFDKMRDMMNVQYGWARPDDPARARLLTGWQRGHNRQQLREVLTAHITEQVSLGLVQNRDDVLTALKSVPGIELTRTTKSSISIEIDGLKVRLTGVFYNEQFEFDSSAGAIETAKNSRRAGRERDFRRGPENDDRYRPEEYAGLVEHYERACQKRAEANQSRYRVRNEEDINLNEVREPEQVMESRAWSDARNSADFIPDRIDLVDEYRLSDASGRLDLVPGERIENDGNRTAFSQRIAALIGSVQDRLRRGIGALRESFTGQQRFEIGSSGLEKIAQLDRQLLRAASFENSGLTTGPCLRTGPQLKV